MTDDRVVSFGNYLFPVMPELCYFKDGNKNDELLFIEDSKGIFTISFEKNMKCIDLIVLSDYNKDYGSLKYNCGEKELFFCYPIQSESCRRCMGYFHLNMPDSIGMLHTLPGQLRIDPSENFLDYLKTNNIFIRLLEGLCISSFDSEN